MSPPPIVELVTGLEAVFPKHTKIKFFYLLQLTIYNILKVLWGKKLRNKFMNDNF